MSLCWHHKPTSVKLLWQVFWSCKEMMIQIYDPMGRMQYTCVCFDPASFPIPRYISSEI